MTGLWLELGGRAVVLGGLGAVIYCGLRILAADFIGPLSCAIQCEDCEGSGEALGGFPGEDCPTCCGSGEEFDDDTAAWDRGHDEFMDRVIGL